VSWGLPFEALGFHYDEQARSIGVLHGRSVAVTLGRREYVLLHKTQHVPPWAHQHRGSILVGLPRAEK
jgi:hypothetical protein